MNELDEMTTGSFQGAAGEGGGCPGIIRAAVTHTLVEWAAGLVGGDLLYI